MGAEFCPRLFLHLLRVSYGFYLSIFYYDPRSHWRIFQGRKEWQTTSVYLPWEPHKLYKWTCHIWPLLCWSRFFLCLFSKQVFIIHGFWIVLQDFFASTEMIIWFLSFSLLMWCITLIDLHILKNLCIPGINLSWSWCMILLMCC